MPHPKTADLDALIQALLSAGVEFIVVGGAAAVLHGAPARDQMVLPILLALRDRLGQS